MTSFMDGPERGGDSVIPECQFWNIRYVQAPHVSHEAFKNSIECCRHRDQRAQKIDTDLFWVVELCRNFFDNKQNCTVRE